MELTHGSLFSGVGGFDLGFERAGFTTLWQVELDPYCQQVLANHFPNARRFANIKYVGRDDLVVPTVITGGFPCQPFSVAGKRRGAADDRWLWPEMRRVIAEVRPRWVVAENVPGIIKLALDQVLSDLEALDYTVGAVTVPACAVDAPHRRERLWIVGYAEHDGQSQTQITPSTPSRSIGGTTRTEQTRQPSRPSQQYADVADAKIGKRCQPQTRNGGQVLAGGSQEVRPHDWWEPEPSMGELVNGVSGRLVRFEGRTATGIQNRVNKLKALGNAVVPAVAEEIARMIIACERQRNTLP